MKGFLGAFLVFLLWISACIYYVSIRDDRSAQTTITQHDTHGNSKDSAILNKNTAPSLNDTDTIAERDVRKLRQDSISRSLLEKETSLLIAEEIQKSIYISDTIDIEKNEPALEFKKEIKTSLSSSFSSKIFYPRYSQTDLILDKELVTYANELKKLLRAHPDKKVTIIGHTDNVGNSKDNFNQGLRKSRQIKWYLTVRRGISRRKITATSRGEEDPLESNNTSRGRNKNNRIEVIVD